MATKKETETKPVETKETGTKAEDQPWNKKKDARDTLEITLAALESAQNNRLVTL